MYETREEWLQAAVGIFRPLFTAIGHPLPDQLLVGVGWPSGGQRSNAIGQCWSASASGGVNQITIRVSLDDPDYVLGTLLHECAHAADDCENGHRGRFAAIAHALGFEKPLTEYHPGPGLVDMLAKVGERLGPFPHSALNSGPSAGPVPPGKTSGKKKQSTRMIKMSCVACGYVARAAKSNIEAHGPVICPCSGLPMEVSE